MSVMHTDVVVIGGGIAGLSTAWYLAEDGVDVALVEAGDLGAAASGANAGSIHLQIQYPEFVAYGEDWARAYAPSLGFLSASVEMWEGLADAFKPEPVLDVVPDPQEAPAPVDDAP